MSAIQANAVTSARTSAHPGREGTIELLVAILGNQPSLPDAACVRYNPTLWDEDVPGETTTQRDDRQRRAVAICRGCPEREACRPAGMSRTGNRGVWGGDLAGPKRRAKKCRLPGCGTRFTITARQKRDYCGDECRNKARSKQSHDPLELRANSALPALTHCQNPNCGVELSPAQRKKRARNCSERCRMVAKRHRARTGAEPVGRQKVSITECAACHDPIPSARLGRIDTCSDTCTTARRRAARDARLRERRAANRAARVIRCPGCSKRVTGRGPRHLYCSDECKAQARWWRLKAARKATTRGTESTLGAAA